VVLMPDSFEDDIIGMAQKIVGSVTLGSGQFCTNPGLQIVLNTPESIQLIDEVFKIMSSMNPGVLLNEAVQSGLEKSVQLTVAHEEVELLTGGRKGSDDSIAFENTVLKTSARSFLEDKSLQREHFGPAVLYVVCNSFDEVLEVISTLDGNLTATIFTNDQNNEQIRQLVHQIREICGRLIMNGFPTGVEVCYAMTHGGPYPATTAPQTSSVGYTAIRRFIRPISFQNMDAALLPEELLDSNPRNIWRIVDGASTNERI
ncbi:MAG: aldehyde dehydrogenase family protein, partial [Bacteroidota bacterium]